MPRLPFVVVSIALVACYRDNPNSCELPDNKDNEECRVGGPCRSNTDCASTPGTQVCDMTEAGGTCVRCTASDHAACSEMTPRCENHDCVGCLDDNDCGDSGVCLLAGDCAASGRIIHTKVNGTTTAGCGAVGNECSLPRALMEVSTTRNIIRLGDAGTYTTQDSLTLNLDVTIDARGATFHRNSDGAILTITGSNKTVAILGGTIEGAKGSSGDGVRCEGGAKLILHESLITNNEESAVQATDCTLTITNTKLQNNSKKTSGLFPGITIETSSISLSRSWITSNAGGGIIVRSNSIFEIVGNAILNNGTTDSPEGGVTISTTESSNNKLEFNTIAANKSRTGDVSGVRCSAGTFIARNNIIWANTSGKSIDDGCMYAYSDIGPAVVFNGNDAGHNINLPPLLMNDASDPHLLPASPVRGAADPRTIPSGVALKDIDGDTRIAPADMGADQVK